MDGSRDRRQDGKLTQKPRICEKLPRGVNGLVVDGVIKVASEIEVVRGVGRIRKCGKNSLLGSLT